MYGFIFLNTNILNIFWNILFYLFLIAVLSLGLPGTMIIPRFIYGSDFQIFEKLLKYTKMIVTLINGSLLFHKHVEVTCHVVS